MRSFLIALTITQNEKKFAGNYWFAGMFDQRRDESVWNWGGSGMYHISVNLSFDKSACILCISVIGLVD